MLPDGVVIRRGQPSDAEGIFAYMDALSHEGDIDLPLAPGEFEAQYTLERERELLQRWAEGDNALYLVAVAEGQIIGSLNCLGHHRRAMRHDAALGITVRREWRGRGIDSAMLAEAVRWAREGGVIKRIHLEVYARNRRAISLYMRHGFQVEGLHRRTVYQGGEYLDEYTMALLL